MNTSCFSVFQMKLFIEMKCCFDTLSKEASQNWHGVSVSIELNFRNVALQIGIR